MKKKLLLITTTSLMTLSLTACQFISDYFDITSGSNNGVPYGSQVVASSHEPIVDVSTPPADDLTTKKAGKTYEDYVTNNVYPLSATPAVGDTKLLVIPVWFNDSNKFIKEANKETVRQDIHDAYFGDIDSVGWESVESYYETESLGALSLTGVVSAWYEVDKSYTYYGSDPYDEETGAGCPKTMALAESATKWYFDNHTVEKRTDYDLDKDGYIDGVMLIYAAPNSMTLNSTKYDNLWAYCYWVQDYDAQNVNNPGVNAFFWASYDFMYGKEVASSRTGNRYYAGDTSHCKIDAHTYIHEMGHMFGLEDYYDYSSYAYSPAGGFSMQDFNVGGHDPFSSFALGWGQAYIPTDSCNIDLKPFATSGEMIVLSSNWNTYDSPFDEYLILEYYTDLGLNALDTTYSYMSQYGKAYPMGSKDYGIRLWHVDARLLYTTTGQFRESMMTTNPSITSGRVLLAVSNTYDDGDDYTAAYLSPLAQDPTDRNYNPKFAEYNLLQLIRNKTSASTKNKSLFSSSDLFKKGDSFSMSKFSKQFVNATKLDNGSDLGFEFTVNACNNTYASISVKKL
ncbi:MAG: immune inhibitor A [Bacilli bacterium]|nr:immune inhibitor A [Bacilli bacterium]